MSSSGPPIQAPKSQKSTLSKETLTALYNKEIEKEVDRFVDSLEDLKEHMRSLTDSKDSLIGSQEDRYQLGQNIKDAEETVTDLKEILKVI